MAEVYEAHAIDLARHVAALRRAFEASPWSGEIEATLTEAFYRWKYNTPAGEALISYVMSDSGPISGVSAFPLVFDLPGRGPTKGWQIGDIMTAPQLRGRGLYRQCLSAIVEQLNNELLICFPNERSRRAIEQAGFVAVDQVRTFVSPVLPFPGGAGAKDRDEIGFSDLPEVGPARSECLSVRTDAKYLVWRYARHPAFSYHAVGGAEGFAVVRGFRLFGMSVAVVMEFHPAEGGAASLLQKVRRWARGNGMVASFLMSNRFPMKPVRSGYLFVPSALMPKQQILYVRYPKAETVDLCWRTQIGDWDGL